MILSLVTLLGGLLLAGVDTPASLRAVLEAHPADSLLAPLRRYETLHGRGPEAGEAAMAIGRLHYARGEYHQAADAFARAAARLDPARKDEARYWAGLAWLGVGDPTQARAMLEEVARAGGTRRADASLGVAEAWAMAQRPERALETLQALLATPAGEATPAALERLIALADAQRRDDLVKPARERLVREFPRSMEAARLAQVTVAPPATPAGGVLAVQIGAFADIARARQVAEAAVRAGFPTARVVAASLPTPGLHAVVLGVYRTPVEARNAGERAARELGVGWRLVPEP